MNTTINIITDNLDRSKAPLYCQYQGQCQPQPAYIELDCRGAGELIADYNGEIGNAVPSYYWHGLAVRWGVSCETSADSLRSLFADDDFMATCQRIVDGFEEEWDGSNFVGRYNDDANSAIEDAERIIDNSLDQVEVYDVESWLFDHCRLTDHWDSQPLDKAVSELEATIEVNQVVNGDIEDALVERTKYLLDNAPDRLNRNHVRTLWRRGEINRGQVREWLREVAA